MTQRVNIQYSVEIDKLPDTVGVLYDNAMLRMKQLNDTMLSLNSALDLEMIDQIDAIRLELAQIDTQLADIDRIVKGYIRFKTSEEQNEENQIPNTPEPNRDSAYEQGIDNDTQASQA